MVGRSPAVFAAIVLVFASLVASDDLIVNLPGLTTPVNFKQYAGYVNVDPANNRNLFYWFVESQNNPATDKLVLWLNGGPGCSSVLGMMTEHGPFRPQPDGTLLINPYAWNAKANVVYLESPAGVGFSYTNTTSDYTVGDERTANDAYLFLQGFLDRYPQYRDTQFWVTGESYGGHYVPELVNRILEGNAAGNPKINLEGFMAGNAWTYAAIDNAGAVFYWWTHAMISDETYNGIVATCDFGDVGPLKRDRLYDEAGCNDYLNTASQEMGNVNIYDIYVDVCLSSFRSQELFAMARAGSKVHQAVAKAALKAQEQINPPYQPCAESYVTAYLNRKDVQTAIHANIPYKWSGCSNLVQYNYSDVMTSVIPLYEKFLAAQDLKILVFSGDVDAIVPVTGTRAWLRSLNMTVTNPWTPWIDPQGQVGGYITEYTGLTFMTVREAGHQVPTFQPQRAQTMFNGFLYGDNLRQN
eukprot:TRINITY_DN7660_c0_g1_i1.p1 TRINITY_DN7660_c0_g1~~TRINITY_DN7660_c0_g1_i1.p1  ORF type:complete len:498 (+),score=133.74 TRINITY_DN7660_c0_g1_i1:88-1494(+)